MFSDEMGILGFHMNNVKLDEINFVEDDLETFS